MKNNMKIMMMVVAGISAALVVVALPPTTVYGQTTTTTPPPTTTTEAATPQLTATTQQIIEEAQAACAPAEAQILGTLCVSVVHESPTTLVLEGDLLVVIGGGEIGYRDNPFIWQAVDQFKAQGYTLTSVLLTGQGSEANPHSWYIVMSK